MDSITITLPKITQVTISPNPVNAKAAYVLSVKVTEVTKVLTPKPFMSGEVYSGEN